MYVSVKFSYYSQLNRQHLITLTSSPSLVLVLILNMKAAFYKRSNKTTKYNHCLDCHLFHGGSGVKDIV